ncbi:hypothetical protein ACOBR2_02745 [Telmatobacter bradus]|uniref:hypothetical protein n=1 Tax=Telmatobacter bradus TaxID=474953 RepID=UPI003B4389FC
MLANTVAKDDFWMQGGSVQLQGDFWKGFSVVADVAGGHKGNMSGSGVGIDLLTTVFGPRYTCRLPHRSIEIYGQGLVGEANGFHSVFTTSSGANSSAYSMALNLGGGVNVPLKNSRFAVRALEASWVRTQLPNAGDNMQNHLRLGAGAILHF